MIIPYELMDYMPFIPLAELQKSNYEFTKKEASQYYEWFVSNVDERANYLRDFISEKQNIEPSKLDFSPDSLILVWKWFLSVVSVERISEEELTAVKRIYAGVPQPMFDELVKERSLRLNVTAEYVLRDIGMYVSKMFIDNYSGLTWKLKLKPKSDVHANLPVIVGFIDDNPAYEKPYYPELEPVDLARTPALKLIRKPFEAPQNDDLLNWCNMWIGWIPKEY